MPSDAGVSSVAYIPYGLSPTSELANKLDTGHALARRLLNGADAVFEAALLRYKNLPNCTGADARTRVAVNAFFAAKQVAERAAKDSDQAKEQHERAERELARAREEIIAAAALLP